MSSINSVNQLTKKNLWKKNMHINFCKQIEQFKIISKHNKVRKPFTEFRSLEIHTQTWTQENLATRTFWDPPRASPAFELIPQDSNYCKTQRYSYFWVRACSASWSSWRGHVKSHCFELHYDFIELELKVVRLVK